MTCAIVSSGALDMADPAALGAEEAHHLRDVLRVRRGERLLLTDGEGRVREASVRDVSRAGVSLCDFEPIRTLPRPTARATLLVCIAKPSRMDWLLEKACELGAERIVPVLSERVVARQKPGETPDRWRRILDSALRQCGGGWATALAPVSSWSDALSEIQGIDGPTFVGSLAPGALPLGDAIADHATHLASGGRCGWLVGPEGDFSPRELESVLALPSAVPVTLGTRVLRVETAAVCGLSAILSASLTSVGGIAAATAATAATARTSK